MGMGTRLREKVGAIRKSLGRRKSTTFTEIPTVLPPRNAGLKSVPYERGHWIDLEPWLHPTEESKLSSSMSSDSLRSGAIVKMKPDQHRRGKSHAGGVDTVISPARCAHVARIFRVAPGSEVLPQLRHNISLAAITKNVSVNEPSPIQAFPLELDGTGSTSFPDIRVLAGVESRKGARNTMEDRICIAQHAPSNGISGQTAFFGVYDGHCGTAASEFLASHLHHHIFNTSAFPVQVEQAVIDGCTSADESFLLSENGHDSGSTAVIALVFPAGAAFGSASSLNMLDERTPKRIVGKRVVIGSVGDCSAVLCKAGRAVRLTRPHVGSEATEANRVRRAGASVQGGRILGHLAVTRAFGEFDLKPRRPEWRAEYPSGKNYSADWVVSHPEVVSFATTASDEFIVLACDGLYDVMRPQEVVGFVRERLLVHNNVQMVTAELVAEAIKERNSQDNVTAIIIILDSFNPSNTPLTTQTASPRSTERSSIHGNASRPISVLISSVAPSSPSSPKFTHDNSLNATTINNIAVEKKLYHRRRAESVCVPSTDAYDRNINTRKRALSNIDIPTFQSGDICKQGSIVSVSGEEVITNHLAFSYSVPHISANIRSRTYSSPSLDVIRGFSELFSNTLQ